MAAIYAPLPTYPPSAVRAGKQGVVAVGVSVHPEGRIQKLSILESPDDEAAASVTKALERWRFHSWAKQTTSSTCPLEGRLVFYFTLEAGKPRVRDAAAEAIAASKSKSRHIEHSGNRSR